MINVLSNELRNRIWIMYLRKSRQDDPHETVEEVLQKHETILQEWAMRELGHQIPPECIYREVVSGEKISEREEIQKVLSRLEDPNVAGVLCRDPQRLSRGDLLDCGHLINTLLYTHSMVATPMMTYDIEDKIQRRFFQDELMRGRDYLEYVKEVLFSGRVSSVKRGCFINGTSPYGYDRVKIGKDWTLQPNKDADTVRMIFHRYAIDLWTPGEIARELNRMGIPSRTGREWHKDTIRSILRNYHYIGKVVYQRTKNTTLIEEGVPVTHRFTQKLDKCIVAEGKHPAIIDNDVFFKAQERAEDRSNLVPKVKTNKELRNPLAGMLYCGRCGKSMFLKSSKGRMVYECRVPGCCKSVAVEDMMNAVIASLKGVELPKLEAKFAADEGSSVEIKKRMIAKLEKQMNEYRNQEETQYELLETKKYTQALFDKRNAALRKKMEDCEKQLNEMRASMPKPIDYSKALISLQEAIDAMQNPDISIKAKNRLMKSIVESIVYTTPKGQKRGENNFKLKISLRV